MKAKMILLAALFTAPTLYAGPGHDHPPVAAKEVGSDGHGQAQAPKGPNGGQVRVSAAGFSYEVIVDADRKLRIAFLDKDGKAVALAGQTLSGIAGERSAPTKLTFAPGKDAAAGLLISDQALPAGEHVPVLLVFKTAPDAKAATERFELHLH
jgi:hypothetical protein